MKNTMFYVILFVLAVVLAFTFVITTSACAEQEEDYSEYWNMISEYSPNDCTTAAIMGWYFRESKFKSNAVTGWPSNPDKNASEKFTEKVDDGLIDGTTRDYFIETARTKYGGYGLGQFSSECFLENLYDFAMEFGTSIGDAEMQCAFAMWYIENVNPFNMYEYLQTEDDPYMAGLMVGKLVEGTLLPESTASYARYFYNEYAENAKGT